VQSNPFDDQGNLELYEEGNPGIILAKYEIFGFLFVMGVVKLGS
jgi:hypothetical protein